MEPIKTITSRVVPFLHDNIDTDIIVPARFLKVTDKVGVDQYLFRDWRFDDQGNPRPDFILNQPRGQGAKILLVGRNFGTGSSREHAPWALMAFGFRALIGTSFADIFNENSLKNGLLPVIVPQDFHEELARAIEADPNLEISVDLASQTVTIPGGKSASFPMDAFSKKCLLAGLDQLGYIQHQEPGIRAYEQSHPSPIETTASA
jgi:3-isopropylmalate/(R)-2-methylmalate dehydratase small subunit